MQTQEPREGPKDRPPILVAEDDPDDARALKSALLEAGIDHPVQVVTDGQDVLNYLEGHGTYTDRVLFPLPLLILLDLRLPRKNGFEVLAWVKSHQGMKRIPVIVLAASSGAEEIGKAYDLGANSFLVKPRRFPEFVEMVKSTTSYWLSQNRYLPPE